MAEVLVRFDREITDAEGRAYVARVCGRETENGLREGWIEFEPRDGGPVLRTPRESIQPNRADLAYWAGGLTVAYLEGALARALHPWRPSRPRTVTDLPRFDRPAPVSRDDGDTTGATRIRPRAVLDPFRAYLQGEDVLRSELGAFDEGHLRNIIRCYDLVGEDRLDLQAVRRDSLAELIVAAVRRRAG